MNYFCTHCGSTSPDHEGKCELCGADVADFLQLREHCRKAGFDLVRRERIKRLEEVEDNLARSQLTLCEKPEADVLRAAMAWYDVVNASPALNRAQQELNLYNAVQHWKKGLADDR